MRTITSGLAALAVLAIALAACGGASMGAPGAAGDARPQHRFDGARSRARAAPGRRTGAD